MSDSAIRTVQLHEGPLDGFDAQVTHNVAKYDGELYVWDGDDDPNRFVYAPALLRRLPEKVRQRERAAVQEWVLAPSRLEIPIGIPEWRLMAWVEVIRYDVKV